MAELTPEQVELVWSEGTHLDRACLYACKNVDTGDTATLGQEYRVVKTGGIVRANGNPAAVTINGITVTFPAGLSDDGVWLLVLGVAI